MNEETLSELGLSINEAKIYTCLLELGLTTITKIAEKSKLHRSNIYDSIKKLIGKGLVSYILKDKVTFYEAANPNVLMRIIKEKENKLKAIIPELLLSRELAASKNEAQVLEGVPAFMQVLNDFLEYNEPIYVYGIPKIAPEMLKIKIMQFHKERIKHKIPMCHIYNYDAMDRIKFLNDMEFTKAKYVSESFDSQVSTNICGDEVVLALWTKPVMIIRIKNKLIADSYKKYFSILWKSSK